MHSGAVSGPAPSAVLALSRLLGSLYDDKGRITVPGFYDDVSEPTERRREELAALPFSEEDWLARSEALSLSGEVGYTVLEQLWTRPTVEVISLIAGDPIGLPRSVVPATASADLVIRTVPDQTYSAVAEQLRQWVAAKLDEDVTFELEIPEETAAPPYQSPEDHPYVLALAEAMGSGFGKPAGRMGNSGGGPADLLARLVDAPVIFFGTGLPEDRWHDSDERASIEVLQNGAATLAHLWDKLSSNASSSDRLHSA
jgi:acetylornithine deacetylase/succinyl-diaminopimelate desuccinylase-like protein